tara:strand:+ start:550 stop:2166 length:1617 start_codon:yes stop_codon:yes gene_type:complete
MRDRTARDDPQPMIRTLAFCAALAWVAISSPAQILVVPPEPVSVTLSATAQDFVHDAARELFYVSVPDSDEVVVISSHDYSIVDTITVSPRPSGLDLSHDGSTLFVALNQAGRVAYVDLTTRTVTDTIDIGTELGHSATWDILEARPDWILVSANPGSAGFAYIVLIRRDIGNAATRVASNRIIRAAPRFHRDPTAAFAYVGEGFSPNSLYKLDLSAATVPIVLEDNHGAVSGSQRADVSHDGSRIALSSGQILDTATFAQVGTVTVGVSQYNADSSKIFAMTQSDLLTVFDAATQAALGSEPMACAPGTWPLNVIDLWVDPTESVALAMLGNTVCGLTTLVGPVVGEVMPSRARFDAGPVALTVHGNFFDLGGAPSLTFGGLPASNVQVVNRTTLTCVAPVDETGPKDVVITNNLGSDQQVAAFHRTPSMVTTLEPVLGGQQVTYRILMTQSDAVGLYLSLGDPVAVLLPGISGEFCLPQARQMLVVPSWPFDALTISLPIPTNPVLSGLRILGQAVTATGIPATAALSNCTSFYLP